MLSMYDMFFCAERKSETDLGGTTTRAARPTTDIIEMYTVYTIQHGPPDDR